MRRVKSFAKYAALLVEVASEGAHQPAVRHEPEPPPEFFVANDPQLRFRNEGRHPDFLKNVIGQNAFDGDIWNMVDDMPAQIISRMPKPSLQ